jgi:hypothetical protein
MRDEKGAILKSGMAFSAGKYTVDLEIPVEAVVFP